MIKKYIVHILKYIVYVFLVIAIGIYSVFYMNYELMLLLLLLIVLPVAVFVASYIARKNIKVSHFVEKDSVVIGEDIPIVVEIENNNFFSIVLVEVYVEYINEFYKAGKKNTILLPTLKRGKQRYYYNIKSEKCGNIKIYMKKVKIVDYFSFFKLKMNVEQKSSVVVMPKPLLIECENVTENTAMFVDSNIYSKTEKGNDPSEVFDYRTYQIGDSLHNINWKLSARKDEYIVKELSLPISSKLVIIMELCLKRKMKRQKKEDMNSYVNTIIGISLGISLKLQELGYEHYISWYNPKSKKCERIKVTEETSLGEIANKLFSSCNIYFDELKVLEAYKTTYQEEVQTHIYYISTFFDEIYFDEFVKDKESVLKNCILIGNSLVESERNLEDELEMSGTIFQKVDNNNIEDTVAALIL